MEQMVGVHSGIGQAIHDTQRGLRTRNFGDGNRTVQRHDRTRREGQQLIVELRGSAASQVATASAASLCTALMAAWIW